MSNSVGGFVTLAQGVIDVTVAAWSTVWAWSPAKQEMARLSAEGFATGATHEVAFSISLAEGEESAMIRSLTEAGFKVADTVDTQRGFVTVTTPVALGAYALARAESRARRVAQRHGGHAELIGPLQSQVARVRLTTGERAAIRSAHSAA